MDGNKSPKKKKHTNFFKFEFLFSSGCKVETAYSQYTALEYIMYMEESANIRPAIDPGASACKPSYHSFLSFSYKYYKSFFFFKFHPSLRRLNSHCKATNQWLITVKCLSPSSLYSNGANCSGKLTPLSQWCQKTTTCTKKKTHTTPS